ncbi:MAG: tetratricopeptide repeat protein [Verrucomicrobia bacterium]|nr:tetratricopeptide repeat protein [Verrucomicrobiota bacterium]
MRTALSKTILVIFLISGYSSELLAKKKVRIEERDLPESSAQSSLKTLFSSLDPYSVSQHLAFYDLYPDTKEGKQSIQRAWRLLSGGDLPQQEAATTLPKLDIQAIISLVTRQSFDAPVKLNQEQLDLISKISERLSNRKLKGSRVWTKEEVLDLAPEEVDISRGLLIFQFDQAADPKEEIRQYEASIDLMALQIGARLPKDASNEDKIREINRFIFQEMQFRFPPHSLYAADIDLYTFLPSVLDSRQGVCLGVSILYLSLAQRLDLPLEIITPPGHIYVRYNDGAKIINIETTARGIDLPSEVYLGINTRRLQKRNMKEVIGLAFMNQAAVFWSRQEFSKTVALYEKAVLFLPKDPLLKMFMGFNYLFVGRSSEGAALLREIRHITFNESVSPETIPDDYLSGKIDAEGIKAVFLPVDETRESILKKQKELQQILKRYPNYRAGQLQLATTWLQLGRGSEAKEILERYHKIDPHSSIVEYYLAILCIERLDYNQAWSYLNQAESLVHARSHHPRALNSIRESLRRISPEP